MQDKKPTRILLIVSDLHLSSGWNEETKRLSPNEDFFFDQSFQRFLNFYIEKGSKEECRINLIIAGDFVDLLQVTDLPEGDSVDGEVITGREKDFGLGTSPKKSCWKLRRLMQGHWIFFQALCRFLIAGHEVTIIPGNHDIEFSLPEVQNCLRDELLKYLPEKATKQAISNLIDENLSFLPWFYYEPGLAYVEHGHQYDDLNSFDYFLHPLTPGNFIDLPAGSFFVRYLFNKVEVEYPFADNMKPVTRFIRWSLGKLHMWLQLPRFIGFFAKTLEKAGPLDPEWVKKLEGQQLGCLRKIASDFLIPEEKLIALKSNWAESAIHHMSTLRLLLRFISSEPQNELFYEAANKVKDIMGVRYIVFGHTHEADLESLAKENWSKEYVNSGTWTKVFLKGYEERLIKEENEFVFVMIDKLTLKMELLRWRDDLAEGERVRFFSAV
jgi:UDP-2,3-diacylglucosamine pyrophosphatase LpxH